MHELGGENSESTMQSIADALVAFGLPELE
jgi:hypothetical protein